MSEEKPPKKDFYISYRSRDVAWAEWIAWQLTEAGYSIELPKWQWGVGSDFVQNIQNALQNSERMLVVLSPEHLDSDYREAEWHTLFAHDTDGLKHLLIPVQVAPLNEKSLGFLRNLVRIDLNGKEETEARETLLSGVSGDKFALASHPSPSFPSYSTEKATNYQSIGVNSFQQNIEEDYKTPIKVFYSYSHKDRDLCKKLEAQLKILKRQEVIEGWDDEQIDAGTEWEKTIMQKLESSQIILLLISSDFLASDFCYNKEMKRAMEKHEESSAIVIPVILRHCRWENAMFGKLQALPKYAKPIIAWRLRDEAFLDVAIGIEKKAKELQSKPKKS